MNGNGSIPDVAPDRPGSSIVHDHPFVPREKPVVIVVNGNVYEDGRALQPNAYLCDACRLAEAAHTQTTVKRERSR